jgi:hypothetical protein
MKKVYVVMGGWQYEGLCDSHIKVFTDKSKAEVYAKDIEIRLHGETDYTYDYAVVVETEIE